MSDPQPPDAPQEPQESEAPAWLEHLFDAPAENLDAAESARAELTAARRLVAAARAGGRRPRGGRPAGVLCQPI